MAEQEEKPEPTIMKFEKKQSERDLLF